MAIEFYGFVALLFGIIYILSRPGKRELGLSPAARRRALEQNQRRDAKAYARAEDGATKPRVYGPEDAATREMVAGLVTLVNRPIDVTEEERARIRRGARQRIQGMERRLGERQENRKAA